MFIGSNMMYLAFHFGSQLNIMFSFQQLDMANICVAVAYGFIIIGFVSIIFVYDELGKSKNSHNKKKS
jgi:hypothetical protein